MTGIINKKISIILMVLIFFPFKVWALPLTKTFYAADENLLDMSLYQELVNGHDLFRKDIFSMEIGFHGGVSADVRFELLHDPGLPGSGNRWGDTFAGFSIPAGRYFDKRLALFYYNRFRIPTGEDPYEQPEWRNISLGRHELLTGPGASMKIHSNLLLSANLFYIFREDRNESMYGDLNFKLTEKEAWKNIFGLNPFVGDSFFHSSKLRNDYISSSASLIYSDYYPYIFFSGIYYSHRPGGGGGGLPIEGDGVNPLLVTAGIKYFPGSTVFIQGSCTLHPLRTRGYIKEIWSFGVNIFF